MTSTTRRTNAKLLFPGTQLCGAWPSLQPQGPAWNVTLRQHQPIGFLFKLPALSGTTFTDSTASFPPWPVPRASVKLSGGGSSPRKPAFPDPLEHSTPSPAHHHCTYSSYLKFCAPVPSLPKL